MLRQAPWGLLAFSALALVVGLFFFPTEDFLPQDRRWRFEVATTIEVAVGGVLLALAALAFNRAAPEPAITPAVAETERQNERVFLVARYIIGAGYLVIGAIVVLLVVYLRKKDLDTLEKTITILTSTILPVVGTWVGAVIAFYFGNSQLRTANDAVVSLTAGVRGGTSRRRLLELAQFKKKDEIRNTLESLDDKGDAACDISTMLADPQKLRERVLVRTPAWAIRYVIPREVFTNLKAASPANPTLKTLLDAVDKQSGKPNRELYTAAATSTFVPADATLADARRALDGTRLKNIFVTANGQRDEAILGWIPDTDLPRGE
ncbi:MAG: hypothetical protein K2X74_10365 [Acetobacteraceae bacterium]|nr:hypothetical protein [Acetobacteraceae bacterium]